MPVLSPTTGVKSPELLAMETGYAQILLLGSIFLMAGRGINQFFFGMHRPHIVTVGALVGNATNIIFNYILIFGEAGLPRFGLPGVPGITPMGVYGAALATVIGSIVECAVPAIAFLGRGLNAELATRAAWRPDFGAMKDLLRIGWPGAVQWGNELICWAIFMTILVGGFGEDHLAACAIAFGYMSLSFMPAVGFSVATNSLVGKYIGAGKPDIAVARARLTLGLAMAYMTACALVFYVFRHPLIEAFIGSEVDPERAARIVEIGGKIMICTAVFQTVDAFGIIYSGALRGAGDTVWPGMVTMVYSWLLIVAGGYAIAHWMPQLESIGPWIASAVYVIAYGLTMWWRFAAGKWRSIDLLGRNQPDTGEEAIDEAADPALGAMTCAAPPMMGEVAEPAATSR
jgi:MATE family multidrug resistance protein